MEHVLFPCGWDRTRVDTGSAISDSGASERGVRAKVRGPAPMYGPVQSPANDRGRRDYPPLALARMLETNRDTRGRLSKGRHEGFATLQGGRCSCARWS